MSIWDTYEVGQRGPMKAMIKEIIIKSDTFIVYMDEHNRIQWFTEGYSDFHEAFGEISSNVSEWESKTNKVFVKEEAYEIKTILAEAYARILDDKNIAMARDILKRAIDRIEKQGKAILKQYYSVSSVCATVLIFLVLIISKYNKASFVQQFGEDEYCIWITALFGGVGAFIFTILKLKDYEPDIVISKRIHVLDGILRIFYGMIGGLVVAVAIKSNLVLGFLDELENTTYVSVFIGICAGASEAIIPNLIKQIEAKTVGQ